MLFRKRKSAPAPQPNFLDVTLDSEMMSMLEYARKKELSEGRIIAFEGYRQIISDKQHTGPLLISQTLGQVSLLEKGVLDGILHTAANDWHSYVTGRVFDNGLLFSETQSIVPISYFSADASAVNVFELVSQDAAPKEIYDAKLEGGLYRGNYYSPPKIRRLGGEHLVPGAVGRICLKRML